MKKYAVIGAGPSGLAAARALQKQGIHVDGFEASHGVGGLWDIANPRSSMYESAHLISSRTTTEFAEYPMQSDVDYPSHEVLLEYFRSYAEHFGLDDLYRFNTRVTRVEPAGDEWDVTVVAEPRDDGAEGAEETLRYDGVILANGTLAEPNVPAFRGEFSGTMMHTHDYKSAAMLEGKRVLIVGAGNSGCDIAVDAVHRAERVDMSVRRGYYFVPRYVFGRPTDTFDTGRPLPRRLKQFVDTKMLRAFTGDPTRFGFPKPDYRIYESHPIVNTMVLNHLGQGDLRIRANIDRFDGSTVHFRDGSHADYDIILLATGYTLDYPFVDREHLSWRAASPKLFLNVFPASFNGLYVMGMIEASGIGWQGRYEQAELLATYLATVENAPARAARFRRRVTGEPWPDVTGGYRYLGLDRMSYYVNKSAYRAAVRTEREGLEAA
ncbi:NAD(P)-binding domain-containing protein [uncultured Microbacterium sp.]|uniref:flavin-containing monooxygenase n=1 Tax=uncultured Microbacterium sp. TaxID=191216 RepID=UPI00260859C1|nr:NAD(P)-binding domain-containing protein [uncultured Microbacterium sp.]